MIVVNMHCHGRRYSCDAVVDADEEDAAVNRAICKRTCRIGWSSCGTGGLRRQEDDGRVGMFRGGRRRAGAAHARKETAVAQLHRLQIVDVLGGHNERPMI